MSGSSTMPPPERLYQIAEETCEALRTSRALRFLCKLKFSFASRRSAAVFEEVEKQSQKISRAIIDHADLGEVSFETRLIAVHLLDTRTKTRFAFDLFLADCDPDRRREIENSTREPIHYFFKHRHVCYARRDPNLDAKVAKSLSFARERPQGPVPFFVDMDRSTFYNDGVPAEDPTWPPGWAWKRVIDGLGRRVWAWTYDDNERIVEPTEEEAKAQAQWEEERIKLKTENKDGGPNGENKASEPEGIDEEQRPTEDEPKFEKKREGMESVKRKDFAEVKE